MSRHVGIGKHWCEYCRTWVQPDPQSIKLHEQGQRHKQAERDFLFNQRKQKHDERHAQNELQKTLAEIEAAAAEAVARDYAPAGGMAGAAGPGLSSSSASSSFSTGIGQGQGSQHRRGQGGAMAPPPPPPPPAQEDLGDGVYSSKGMLYLMGEHDSARTRLVTGSNVEVLTGNEWRIATITAVQEVAVAYTKIVLRKYDVQLQGGDTAAAVQGVQPNALRLPLTAAQADALRAAYKAAQAQEQGAIPSEAVAEAAPEGPKYEIDPNTGLGKWSVMERPSEDEEQVLQEEAKQDNSGSLASRKRPLDNGDDSEDALHALHHDPSKALDLLAQKRAKTESMRDGLARRGYDDSAEHAEGALDALAAFNPHVGAGGGPRLYKGIALAGDDVEDGGEGHALPHRAQHLFRPPPHVQHPSASLSADTVKMEQHDAGTGKWAGPFPPVMALQPVVAHLAGAPAPTSPAATAAASTFAGRKPPTNFKARKRDDDD